jgi:predicted double-glycine peptidase
VDYVGKVILSDHALSRMSMYRISQKQIHDTLQFGLEPKRPAKGKNMIKLVGPEVTVTINTERSVIVTVYINDRDANWTLAEKAAKRKKEAFVAETMKKLCSKGDWRCGRLKSPKKSYKQELKRSTSTLW